MFIKLTLSNLILFKFIIRDHKTNTQGLVKMSDSSYKLYYFPTKGRAEPIRLLFAYKGIKYEDIRLAGEKWTEFKPQTPFEEGGQMLGGSNVILRYLAEKSEFNVAGSNDWENAWLANISDYINDFANEFVKFAFEKDEEKKKELEAKFGSEIIPKYLGKLNEMTSDTGYLCCGKLTWPDLQLFTMVDILAQMKPEAMETFPGCLHSLEWITGMDYWNALTYLRVLEGREQFLLVNVSLRNLFRHTLV